MMSSVENPTSTSISQSTLTNDQLSRQLQAIPLLLRRALPENGSVLQHPASMMVTMLVLDVFLLMPARGFEARDEAASPE